MRPDSVVGDDVHIGNFVELKKTSLGAGSKADHLAYLGDATIGEDVNIGAGTITCNYDGAKKHPTIIEDGVFIGSDSQLDRAGDASARARTWPRDRRSPRTCPATRSASRAGVRRTSPAGRPSGAKWQQQQKDRS